MQVNLGRAIAVTSTDLWLDDLAAGRCFMRGLGVAQTGGAFSELQLFNPVGSSVTILVRAIWVSLSVTDALHFRLHNTALGTLDGAGVNLLSGAAAGAGELRSALPAAADGTRVGQLQMTVGVPVQVAPDWIFQLDAGEGLIIVPTSANVGLSGTFFWRER